MNNFYYYSNDQTSEIIRLTEQLQILEALHYTYISNGITACILEDIYNYGYINNIPMTFRNNSAIEILVGTFVINRCEIETYITPESIAILKYVNNIQNSYRTIIMLYEHYNRETLHNYYKELMV